MTQIIEKAKTALRVAARVLVVCALFRPALSKAQTAFPFDEPHSPRHDNPRNDPHAVGFAAAPELENRPRSGFENSLMSELACTCPTCKLEPINTCRCDFAAKMRGEMLDHLKGLDLATDGARRAAANAVRASFVARYGPTALARTNQLDPKGRIAAFVVAGIIVSPFIVILIRRRVNRPPVGQRR